MSYGTTEAKRSGRRRVNAATRPAAHSTCGSVTATARLSLTPAPRPAPKVISPVVRKLARDNKIDLAAVVPANYRISKVMPSSIAIRRTDGRTSPGTRSPSTRCIRSESTIWR